MKNKFKITSLSLSLIVLIIASLNGQNFKCDHASCQSNIGNYDVGHERPTMGTIQENTNLALPFSYNFQEYVFSESDDQGICLGVQNSSATIANVFLSQTHRHEIGHPMLFTIGERPVLFQTYIFGTGESPDVQLEGVLNGVTLGTLCLKGPSNLSTTIDLNQPNFDDYFSVTIPKAWIQEGLILNLTAGADSMILDQEDLKIRPYSELNLVLFDIDVMDYNFEPHRTPIFEGFLGELASAIPTSEVRFGKFPKNIKLPILAVTNDQGATGVVETDDEIEDYGINTGNINGTALAIISRMQQATGDFPNTIYFGNTLNLDPGGWGSDGSFVSYDYTGIFIHELGHALSLPHWEEEFSLANPEPDQHLYPYGGEGGEAGGRGEAWNFIQDIYEFASPFCEDNDEAIGAERSDCMQREISCLETRPSGPGPWDGFGDFSAKAMSNYILGSEIETGQVSYRGELVDFQFKENYGYPRVSLENGKRQFTRTAFQPNNTYAEDFIKLPGEELIEQDVYMIFGSAHATMPEANIIYDPIRYKGTLLPNIDPTDQAMFAQLQNLEEEDAPLFYNEERDITIKLIYVDGTERHVLAPFSTFERPYTGEPDEELSPGYFAVVVPADTLLCGVELYHRAFICGDENNFLEGNINMPSENITADNFMDEAVLMATLDHSCNCPGSAGYIEPGTPCDDGNPLTIDDVEDGFCNCAGTAIPPCGFVTNGTFDAEMITWNIWGNEASTTNGEAIFENINFGDAGIAQAGFNFEQGEVYTISFEAYALETRTMDIFVYLDEEPWTEYYAETIDLTTTKQTFEISYTHLEESVNNGAVEFFIGDAEAVTILDNICFDIDCELSVNPDCDQVLSISDASFHAELVDELVLLKWESEDEINLSHYIPEHAHSSNPNIFNAIGRVESGQLHGYSFTHEEPRQGPNYYRLKSVDLDGSIDYSNIIAVNLEETKIGQDFEVIISPNPADQQITISEGTLLGITDVHGKQYAASLNVSNLPSGIYFAQIRLDNKNVVVERFLKH